jgi:hypothetical protein
VDNTNNCVAGGPVNCWTWLPGTLTEMSVGADGTVYGLNSAHTIYRLPMSTSTSAANWVASTLTPVIHLAVQDAADIYSLGGSSACSGGTLQLFKANSTLNGWLSVSPAICGNTLGVSSDGTIGVVNLVRSSAYTLTPGAANWVQVSGTGFDSEIAVQNQHTAYALKGASVYKINIDNNTVTLVNNLAASDISVTPTGILWLIGGNSGDGTGNSYSYDTNASHLVVYRGFLDKIVSGGPAFTFGLASGTGNVYHFRDYVPSLTIHTEGYYDCGQNGLGCPSGSAHTEYSTAAFQAGGLHGVNGVKISSGQVAPTS